MFSRLSLPAESSGSHFTWALGRGGPARRLNDRWFSSVAGAAPRERLRMTFRRTIIFSRSINWVYSTAFDVPPKELEPVMDVVNTAPETHQVKQERILAACFLALMALAIASVLLSTKWGIGIAPGSMDLVQAAEGS